MNLLEANRQLINDTISNMPQGYEAGLAEIFGETWLQIGGPGQRKEFGRQFKAAVKVSEFPDIAWVRIENSGRYDVYKKI